MNGPGTSRAHRQKMLCARLFSSHICPAVPHIFLTALFSYAAADFPRSHGESLLATENSQPVTSQSGSLDTHIVRHEGESPCTDAPPIPGCTKARKSSCCCGMAPALWTNFRPTPRPPLCSTRMG